MKPPTEGDIYKTRNGCIAKITRTRLVNGQVEALVENRHELYTQDLDSLTDSRLDLVEWIRPSE
jgi:hypothetical protein